MLYMGCEGWSLVLGKNVPESGVQATTPWNNMGGGGGEGRDGGQNIGGLGGLELRRKLYCFL